ncbi:MAG TPA: sigma-70 family RNA polymerase sigma factor [Rhizomicrobium sp.]|nr:sigma-70 family RNA polymerase sigma factor [Rhizomicrobium sp.]
MDSIRDINWLRPDLRHPDAGKAVSDIEAWFVRDVLPLEATLMRFLNQNWRNKSELEDLRQDVYARILENAEGGVPEHTKAFVLTTARNLLINRVRREHIVPIDAMADLEGLNTVDDTPGADRVAIARDTLRRLQAALDRLPPRCREVVLLRRVEGLSRQEIAARMGISEKTVAAHMTSGMCALANFFLDNSDGRSRA